MKLHTVQSTGVIAHGGKWRITADGHRREARGRLLDTIAVAHPHQRAFRHVAEQHAAGMQQFGAAIFAVIRQRHLAAQRKRKRLHAVTHAEDRLSLREQRRLELRGIGFVNAVRPAAEDVSLWLMAIDCFERRIEREDLGVHAQLADTPCDQLCVL
jgi:hypothetical protein